MKFKGQVRSMQLDSSFGLNSTYTIEFFVKNKDTYYLTASESQYEELEEKGLDGEITIDFNEKTNIIRSIIYT